MSESFDQETKLVIAESTENQAEKNEPSTSGMSGDRPTKRVGRRPGRRSSKMDVRAKLERSRQSARECRARKKLRYQYLEDLVANREKAVFALREELELYKQWCIQVDKGLLPLGLLNLAKEKEAADQDEKHEGAERVEEVVDLTENGGEMKSERREGKASRHSSRKDKMLDNAFRSEFKIPNSSTSRTVTTLTNHSPPKPSVGAAGFVSDLSSFSTIGLNDLKSARNMDSGNSLCTIKEEDSQEKDVNTFLLPTFVEDFNKN